ncbi:MAG: DUF3307 domain-containing protein [Elusimicrobia bacterium]|nr:DUF3307 domain-containing protein [Elusimicrobiota bacterium]
MAIFWRLVFGHFLADFTLQTNFINEWKRTSNVGMIVHCLTHPVCYIILTYPYLFDVWITVAGVPIHGLLAISIITATHYLEDIWRVNTIKKYNTPDSTLYLIWDQVVHLSVIFIFFGTSPDGAMERIVPEQWPVIGTLIVIATHFSVVLVYFLEKDFFNRDYPDVAEKYVAIGERLLAFLAAAFIGDLRLALAVVLAALLLPRITALSLKRPVGAPPNFSWAAGSLLAVAAGLAGRMIL